MRCLHDPGAMEFLLERFGLISLSDGDGTITQARLQRALASVRPLYAQRSLGQMRTRTLRVHASYRCACGRAWTSSHGRVEMSTNLDTVRLIQVFGQMCERCSNVFIAPHATDADLREMMDYLCRNLLGLVSRGANAAAVSTPPHRAHLCEACRRGRPCIHAAAMS
jgi:hypothetical protein